MRFTGKPAPCKADAGLQSPVGTVRSVSLRGRLQLQPCCTSCVPCLALARSPSCSPSGCCVRSKARGRRAHLVLAPQARSSSLAPVRRSTMMLHCDKLRAGGGLRCSLEGTHASTAPLLGLGPCSLQVSHCRTRISGKSRQRRASAGPDRAHSNVLAGSVVKTCDTGRSRVPSLPGSPDTTRTQYTHSTCSLTHPPLCML